MTVARREMLIVDTTPRDGSNYEERLVAWRETIAKRAWIVIGIGTAENSGEGSERGAVLHHEARSILLSREDAMALADMIRTELEGP